MKEYTFSITKQFKQSLDKIKSIYPDLNIYYFYPAKFTNKPCLSYKLGTNTVTDKTIKQEPRRQEAIYYVDLWGASPEVLQNIADDLKDILYKDAYTCAFEQTLKDVSELYYHHSMRFQAVFDNKLKVFL